MLLCTFVTELVPLNDCLLLCCGCHRASSTPFLLIDTQNVSLCPPLPSASVSLLHFSLLFLERGLQTMPQSLCVLVHIGLSKAFISGACASAKRELLALMVRIFWILLNTARTSQKGICGKGVEPFPALEVINLFNVLPQMGEEWCHVVALIYIFLIITEVEQCSYV